MKVKLISPQKVRNPQYDDRAQAAANREGRAYNQRKYIERPAGYEVETSPKDCVRLVSLGVAEPADDDSMNLIKSKFTESQLWRARIAQRRVAKGIHPDDYDKFESGEIDGYAPDGSYILGPNGEAL